MIYQALDVQPFDPANHAVTASARRKRLMGAPGNVPSRSKEAATVGPVRLVQFDAHVKAWKKWLRHKPFGPLGTFIYRRCTELGVPYMKIVGEGRRHAIVLIRHQIMWEMRNQMEPTPSLPEIARAFGGRDHTSALNGIRKHEMRRAGK